VAHNNVKSIIAGALYIVKSRVGYKRSFEHDSLELSCRHFIVDHHR